jgi:hypothetical protein
MLAAKGRLNERPSASKSHAAFMSLVLPFFAMEAVIVLYVLIQGRSLYFLTSERSLYASFAIILAAAYMLVKIPPRIPKLINILDVLFIAYAFLNLYSMLLSFLGGQIDIIFLKQVFFFICMLFFYLYGRFIPPQTSTAKSSSLFFTLIFLHLIIAIANGLQPGADPGFVALSALLLFSSTFNKSLLLRVIACAAIVVYLAPIISNLNRTLIAWLLIFLTATLFQTSYRNKLILLAAIVSAISLVFISAVAIQDYKIQKSESRSVARLNQLVSIARTGTTSQSVSISDRIHEIEGVKRKFAKEGSGENLLMGFGGAARYDSHLTTGVIFGNHNVHVGFYWEYLKRGYLGVFLFIIFNLAVLYSGIRQKDWSYAYRGEIRWILFWYYIASLMFWFTWANFYYTQPPVWLYVGMVFARKARVSSPYKNIAKLPSKNIYTQHVNYWQTKKARYRL